jgi:hypothetical protein
LIRPGACFVSVDAESVRVQMDWVFRASFARSTVTHSALGVKGILLGLGVHGFRGRWLVNGSLDGLVTLQLAPVQRAYVLGLPVKLHELQLSLEDPTALLALFPGTSATHTTAESDQRGQRWRRASS